jgi:hypothetical protein
MKHTKLVSLLVAFAATTAGVAAVLDPLVPDAWKGAVTAFVGVLNYLAISPIAKALGASEGQE